MTASPRKETISSRVCTDLRGKILRAKLAPGEKINLDTLRDQFQTSISPLREALARLTAEGLVEFEDQRGFRVAPVSRADFLDLAALRADIECAALRSAILEGDMTWESGIVRALHRLRRIEPDADPDSWNEAHDKFHAVLISGASRPILLQVGARLAGQCSRYRALAELSGDGETAPAPHEAIAAAATRRDAEAAQTLLRAHLDDEAEAILSALNWLA